MGVLSALPIVNIGNACCCLWVITGGVVAAYLLQQNDAAPITPGDGALVGLFAGLIGAFATFLISIPIDLLLGPFEREMSQRVIDMAGTMPPEVREMLQNMQAERGGVGIGGMIVFRVLALFVMLCLGAVFSTIGGLLGAVIFRKRLPPGTLEVPPSS